MFVGSFEHRNHFIFLSTMETKNVIEFHYSKECKRPRSLDSTNNLFCLYAPEEITISGNELKTVDLKTKIILLSGVSSRFRFLSSFERNRLYIQNNDIIDYTGWLKMKLLNQNFLRKITIANQIGSPICLY